MRDPVSWLMGPDWNPCVPTVEEVASWLPAASRRPRRFLLLSDIHANWHALTAVLRHARGRYDAIWFLGDIVGYGPRPLECVRFLKRYVSPTRRWRAGNHDLGASGKLDGVEDTYKLGPLARWSGKQHRRILQGTPRLWRWFQRAMVMSRAEPALRSYGGFGQLLVHANPVDLVGDYLYPDERFNIQHHFEMLQEASGAHDRGAWLLVGHTHMVCLARLNVGSGEAEPLPISYGEPIDVQDTCYLINPGSVGQPRDGDRRAAYAILDVREGCVTYHRVEYDVVAVQREMQQEGYPDVLVERLETARIQHTQYFDDVYERVPEDKPERLVLRV